MLDIIEPATSANVGHFVSVHMLIPGRADLLALHDDKTTLVRLEHSAKHDQQFHLPSTSFDRSILLKFKPKHRLDLDLDLDPELPLLPKPGTSLGNGQE